MGCGSWTRDSYVSYSTTKGMSVSTDGMISGSYSNQDMFKARNIDSALNPKNVIRECCDTEEHPNTIPVILALDVTGSMGQAAVEVAKKLNVIMTKLYEKVTDVEFLIMGIGDLACDSCPIQASQFESDIRIAEQLDKIYFEFGGCHLGCMSYDEYEKYFEKVEIPVKKPWGDWSLAHELTFMDIKGDEKTIKYQYRDNGKRVQVRSGVLKAGSSCYDEDEFSLSSGLELAEMRLVVKYLDNQVKSIAKSM